MDIVKFSPRLKSFNRDRCIVVGSNSKTENDLCLRFYNFPKANAQIIDVKNVFGNLKK